MWSPSVIRLLVVVGQVGGFSCAQMVLTAWIKLSCEIDSI